VSDDFKYFYCWCSPSTPRATGGGSSNVIKHHGKKKCSSLKSQTRLTSTGSLVVPTPRNFTQTELDSLVVNFVVETGQSFGVVEAPSFRKLVLHDPSLPSETSNTSSGLKVISRRTLGRQLDSKYEEVRDEVRKLIWRRDSPLAITMDGWKDRTVSPYISYTAQFFDNREKLNSLLLALEYVPATTPQTAQAIKDTTERVFEREIGARWKSAVGSITTDGGSNFVCAVKMLSSDGVIKARACVQHRLNLAVYHLLSSSPELASPVAVCQFMARQAHISASFRNSVGNIPTGSPTRWASYVEGITTTYNARKKLLEYMDVASDGVKSRLYFLNNGGFQMLHDLALFLRPFSQLALDTEGELVLQSLSSNLYALFSQSTM